MHMPRRVCVLSDGAWATTIADLLARKGVAVELWCEFPEVAQQIRDHRVNEKFLPDVTLHEGVSPVTQMSEAVATAELVVFTKPVLYLRPHVERVAGFLRRDQVLLSVAKGIENSSLLRASQIIDQVTGRHDIAMMLGPSHAEEVARRLPASVVAAAEEMSLAEYIQTVFTTDRFRVYTSDDTVGTEIGACIKNVVAIAAGVCEGLGFGDNSRSALLTRGLAEIRRLGVAMGARPETFSGLTGIGDLITTCVSPYGRNRRVGLEIGRGKKLSQVLEEMGSVVPEGVWTTKSAVQLAERHDVEMPITEEVYRVLFEDKPPLEAVSDLMMREPKSEVEGLAD